METLFNILAVILPLIILVVAGSVLSLLLVVFEQKADCYEKTEAVFSVNVLLAVALLYIYLLSAKYIIYN